MSTDQFKHLLDNIFPVNTTTTTDAGTRKAKTCCTMVMVQGASRNKKKIHTNNYPELITLIHHCPSLSDSDKKALVTYIEERKSDAT